MRSAYQQAIECLSRREHSAAELRQKLQQAGHDAELIESCLQQVQQQGYQSDRRFADSLLNARRRQGQGPLRIEAELHRHRLDPELVADSLAQFDDWQQQAARVRERKFGSVLPTSWPEQARQARFLAYRGFGAGLIQSLWRAQLDDY